MYEGITFEDFLKVGARGKTQKGLGMGVPGHHEDFVELWLLADPKFPPGLFYKKALETI